MSEEQIKLKNEWREMTIDSVESICNRKGELHIISIGFTEDKLLEFAFNTKSGQKITYAKVSKQETDFLMLAFRNLLKRGYLFKGIELKDTF